MTKPVTIPNTFATATTAIPLSQLDGDFTAVATAINDANTYSNYAADTGSANAYVVTFSGVSTAYSAGLRIQFKAGNANTGASTINVNAQGAKSITYQDGNALASGTIAVNSIVDVMYDGTQFLLMNDPAGATGGDVTGPASATDNAVVRFDGTTGKLVQNSVVTIADSTGDISGVGQLNATTVDTTNLEVTNIKAIDGTAAASIANSTGVVTVTAAPVMSALTASQAVFTTAGKALTSNAITGTGNVVMSDAPTLTGTISAAAATLSGNLTLSGGTANGVLYLNGSKVATSGSGLVFDSSGNLGLGVTPSAWNSNYKAIQVKGASFFQGAANTEATISANNFVDGVGDKYIASAAATAYTQFNGQHIWKTAPSGTAGNAITFTQAMTLDASGNLGIGSTSPSTNLVIGGTASGAGSAGSLGVFLSRGVTTNFYEAYDGTKSMIAGVDSNQSFIKIGAFSNHPLAFVTNNGERARITSDGYFKATSTGTYSAGTTGVVHEFDTSSVDGTIVNFYNQAASNPNGIYVGYTAADPNDATRYVFGAQQNTGTWIYRIYSNGTVAARSDVKWKKNIETTRDGYAEDLAKLRVVKYNWYNHEDGTPKELGLIAQEVEQVFPRLVTTDEQTRDEVKTREIPAVLDEEGNEVEPARTEEYTEKVGTGEYSKSIKFSVLPIMLLKAIQEQQALIESLTTRVSQLEGA